MPTRILVTGDRHWFCLDLAKSIVRRLRERYGPDVVIVHGGARGVDEAFAWACRSTGVACEIYPADWKTHGKKAGPIRNQAMVDAGATFALAFHRRLAASLGTKDCVRRCLKAGIPVWLIESENSTPLPIDTPDPPF